MDLRTRRGLIGSKEPEEELYPVGTDVLSKYIGISGRFINFDEGYLISPQTGELVAQSGYYASAIFIPINPKYTYRKSGNRINMIAFYKQDKTFISGKAINNTNVETITGIPAGAKWIRVGVNSSNRAITITRTE